MNKHLDNCRKREHGDAPCTCSLGYNPECPSSEHHDPPPVTLRYAPHAIQDTGGRIDVPCPHCNGTGRLTMPEPPEYKPVEPYVGGEPPRTHFDPTNDPMNGLHEEYCDEQVARLTDESIEDWLRRNNAARPPEPVVEAKPIYESRAT